MQPLALAHHCFWVDKDQACRKKKSAIDDERMRQEILLNVNVW